MPPVPPAAVIFDLDGVLIDSEQMWDATRRELAADAGRPWPQGATRAMMGMSAPEWSRYMAEEVGLPGTPEEIDRRVVDRMAAGYRAHLPLLPGASAAVRGLAARWPLALATSTNAELIGVILEAAGIADCFTATVSSEEVGRGKPAPDVYLEAARRLGAAPDRCVAIEDSSAGLRSAAAAGTRVIAIPNAHFPPDPEALALAAVTLSGIAALDPGVVERL